MIKRVQRPVKLDRENLSRNRPSRERHCRSPWFHGVVQEDSWGQRGAPTSIKKGEILTGSRQQRGSTGVETLRRSVGYSPDLWKDPPRQELLAERQGRRRRSDGNWATKAASDTRRTDWCRSLLRFRHGPYEKKRDRPGCAGNATWLGDLWKTDGEMVAPLEKQLPRLAATTLQVEKRRDWPGDQRPGVGIRRQSSPNTLPFGGGDPAIPRSRWSEPGRSDPHFHSRNHPACR
ncbi:hypothetical protein T10_5854 [Trichinella papuae]|uniref:Uncharacterized protein n=1 Tax=Trichinella papuae TaxID=268474 RepID=A0A0V1N3I5_9BILA|nr:hypothetical protein T10_5854 [Trichinella papuae]